MEEYIEKLPSGTKEYFINNYKDRQDAWQYLLGTFMNYPIERQGLKIEHGLDQDFLEKQANYTCKMSDYSVSNVRDCKHYGDVKIFDGDKMIIEYTLKNSKIEGDYIEYFYEKGVKIIKNYNNGSIVSENTFNLK
jgi:hypothetical protein